MKYAHLSTYTEQHFTCLVCNTSSVGNDLGGSGGHGWATKRERRLGIRKHLKEAHDIDPYSQRRRR